MKFWPVPGAAAGPADWLPLYQDRWQGPLVRRDVVARYGPRMLAVLDTVSAHLTTGSLRALDARVELRGQDLRLVAGSWLRTQGLASMGGALH